MGAVRCLLWFALLSGAACGSKKAPKAEMAAHVPGPPSEVGFAQAGSATRNDGLPPLLSLRAVRSVAGVGLRVVNASSVAVELAPSVSVEALGTAGPRAPSAHGLKLQRTCASSGCVRLAPGAEIDAPVWLGRPAGERCGTTLLVPTQPGAYRFRIARCDGSQSFSTEFSWPVQ